MVLLDFKGSAAAKSDVQYGTTRHDDEYSSESKFLHFLTEMYRLGKNTFDCYFVFVQNPNYMKYYRYNVRPLCISILLFYKTNITY